MNKSELYSALIRFGTCYPMKLTGTTNNICETLDEKYKWIRYNPRKNIDRDALSITSLDGGMSGIPDLDSLLEWYRKTGDFISEDRFNVKTEIYPYFKEWLDPLEKYLGRTHIIRLNPGGFFPSHRDCRNVDIDAFRLFLPMSYTSQNNFFMLEDKKLEFNPGQVFFIDTCKTHAVFNSADFPWHFVVINVALSRESVDKTLSMMYE